MQYTFRMLEGECWWGGTSVDGLKMPLDKNADLRHDFRVSCPNQTMPMFLSNRGRCIWSEEPFAVTVKEGEFLIDGTEVVMEQYGSTLRDAYVGAQAAHFPPSGNELPEEFFRGPQYNTWMQHTYNPTQEKVMQYAREILDNGFAPGILIIDEGWQKEYGLWEYDPIKFPDPKKMADELHEMGFILMLWIVPYVRADGFEFVKRWMPYMNPESHDKLFVRNKEGKILIARWWNGYSAMFDLTKECDAEMLDGQLQALINDYGVDGFKFDAFGSPSGWDVVNGPVDSAHSFAERNIAWNEFGTRYRYHEYKDTFKGGGKRTIQRIRDRGHRWDDEGLDTLIPNAILQGVLGHPFVCPDMIGGGSWIVRDLHMEIDEELFVRMAQCSALFPMMQFSWAPWESLSAENLAHVKAAQELHLKLGDTILALVNQAYADGEPIFRALAYNYPDGGYEYIQDQFMLGTDILAAPVVRKGESVRKIVLPAGTWIDPEGQEFAGGQTIDYPVTLASVPYFMRKK